MKQMEELLAGLSEIRRIRCGTCENKFSANPRSLGNLGLNLWIFDSPVDE